MSWLTHSRLTLRSRLLLIALTTFFFSLSSLAQMPVSTSTTSTPVPGVGHDYIGEIGETVNPATGSVSIRLNAMMPPGRGLSLPFSFAYDSNGVNYVGLNSGGILGWLTPSITVTSQGGWSNSVPVVSLNEITWTGTSSEGHQNPCFGFVNYVYQDAHGDRHNLNLTTYNQAGDPSGACTFNYGTQPNGFDSAVVTEGGEAGSNAGAVVASIPSTASIEPGPITVSEPDGTILNFPTNPSGMVDGISTHSALATSVEDRNGNIVTINSSTSSPAYSYVDTVGRTPALQDTGFAMSPETVTVSGLGGSYTITWQNLSTPTFTTPVTVLSGTDCSLQGHQTWATPSGAPLQAISSIELPNLKTFSFSYDSTYGVLTKMTYPTGGYVRYVWGTPNPTVQSSMNEWGVNITSQTNAQCTALYEHPVITDRYVSFDGSTEILHQHFTYSTTWSLTCGNGSNNCPTWTSKQTTVNNTDSLLSTNYNTVYTYSPIGTIIPPNTAAAPTSAEPVETNIAYYDITPSTTTSNGTLLKTVQKTWANTRLLTSEKTIYPGGQTSETTYTYNAREQQTEQDDYDFGSGAVGSVIRRVVTNYQTFNDTPFYPVPAIVDRPCQVITYQGSGTTNRVAETDYYYDSGPTTTPCGAAGTPSVAGAGGNTITGHDVSNYGVGAATCSGAVCPRGNITAVVEQCFVGSTACSLGNSTTTYTYDETGQVLSITDPKGNTTSYSHGDSYVSTNSSGFSTTAGSKPTGTVTDAYLTKVTHPTVNNVTLVETYSYGYNDGELTVATDANGQQTTLHTTYKYNDPLGRLTETDYPDTGQTTLFYNDSVPSVQTTKLISTSPSVSLVSTSVMDGLAHVTQTQLTSDPDGTTYTATKYNGDGRKYQVYNPTRCSPPTTTCGETTWGVTTYTYDGLGRPKTVTQPDNSVLTTTYNQTNPSSTGICTTVTDEAGKSRQSCADGLGRMTGVWENPGGLNYETDYAYDPLNNLLSVTQKGGAASTSWRNRSFVYDSLSRLTGATNPESGAIGYTYDLNGNTVTRVMPQANQTGTAQTTTTYVYDALNRLTSLTHTNPSGATSAYAYDGAAISGCPGVAVPTITSPTNLLGRRSTMCSQESASSFSFDSVGRIATEVRTNGLTNPPPITLTTGYLYNLDGSLKKLTYPSGDAVTYTVGAAGRATQVSDATNTFVAAPSTGPMYAPQGALVGVNQGSGITTYNTYNNRLQPVLFSASNHSVSTSISSSSYTVCTPPPNGECFSYAVYAVSNSSGINVGDAVTVTGNSNTFFNGNFTVQSVSSGQVLLSGASSATNETGQGGVLTDSVSGLFFSRCYDFHLGGGTNIPPCSFATAPQDNGNLFQIVDNVDSTRSATFTYDALNRITQAESVNTVSANCWGEAYTIDAWGNLTNIAAAPGISGSCFTETLNTGAATIHNQLGSYCYDAAGNLLSTTCGTATFNYDPENRLYNPTAPYTYLYDADGVRIRKAASSTVGTFYWPGPSGEYLTEANGSGVINEEYIFFNGERIARVDRPSGTVNYYFSDDLQSTSTVTSPSGAIQGQYYYYPYGGLLTSSGGDPNHYLFTGKERDNDSGEFGFDYFGARYYGSSFARFSTPDWAAKPTDVPYASFGNPQSLNLYSYVNNNPTTTRDPDGHCYPLCTVVAGAVVGGVIGAVSEIISDKLEGKEVTRKSVEGAAVKGAITGAAIGAAGPEAGILTTAALGAGGNVAGGIADRKIEGGSVKEVLDPKEMGKDAASGAIGGAVSGAKLGEKAGEFVAQESAKVAEASGDQVAAKVLTKSNTALGVATGNAIDIGQGLAEGHINNSQQGAQQQTQQQVKTQCTTGEGACH